MLIGAIELVPLADAVGRLGELEELYPDVPPEAWQPYRELYPELFAGTKWRLPVTCYLVRSAGTTILVDTGVGPEGLWGDWEAEPEGGLPAALEATGLGPDEIDVVFLTHLHIDHIGWNADREGAPLFGRYVVSREAIAFARERVDRPHVRRCVVSLGDRLAELEGETELAPGVTAVAYPGHYPGHTGLRLRSEGVEAMLAADAAVHPALLDRPEWEYVSDVDRSGSVATRTTLVPDVVDSASFVVCGHYPGTGIGHVRTRGDRVIWEPA
jgi:glyoxylase-like metal-dependent hydrolase (beta-lactamase superfamily II)